MQACIFHSKYVTLGACKRPGVCRGNLVWFCFMLNENQFSDGDATGFTCRNVCHGSDSVVTAKREIALWFKDSELVEWKPAQTEWIYE